MVGKKLGRYQVIDELGAGDIGVVCEARGLRLDHFVALKSIPPERSPWAQMHARPVEARSI